MRTLLFVCTGNLCRSPLMERLLRNELGRSSLTELVVRSAGTHAYEGDAMHPNSLAVLVGRGMDGADFRTTYLSEQALDDVDIVVAATRAHRAAAVTLRPALLKRAFTLAELSRIAATIDAAELPQDFDKRVDQLATLAAARRSMTLPTDPRDDDLIDPLGGPMEDFAACAATVEGLLAPIVDLLVVE